MPAAAARRLDVVIVGAGAAGLAAAGDLSQAGLRVVLLEARARLGGRAWTRRGGGWPIPRELGAEFVHGRGEEFFAMLHEAGLPAIRLPERRVERVGSRLRPSPDIWDQFDSLTRRLGGPGPGKGKGKDRSVAEELRRRPRAFSARERRLLTWMIESYDAAPIERASARALSTVGEPRVSDDDRAQFRLVDGYRSLVDWLACRVDPDRCEIVRSAPVRHIEWRRGRVRVTTGRGDFQARRALVTVPIGVLRAPAGSRGAIVFDPDPPVLRRAVSGLEMGDVVRLLLRFREPFWREAPQVRRATADPNFFHFPSAPFPTWWTCAPIEEPVLTAWAGGSGAASLRRLPDRRLVRRALESFASGIGVPLRRTARGLLDWDLHDWTADPYARGAYSYALVGGASAGARLMRPIAGTLFFAGEAIGEGDSGTVPAAIASGRRAARKILR
jgi:monoamine oxidase